MDTKKTKESWSYSSWIGGCIWETSEICFRAGCAVWHPALTKYESRQIERVQRSAFYVILGEEYENYENALDILGSETLDDRRVKLCQKFARKAIRNPKYTNWFCPDNRGSFQNIKTRGCQTKSLNVKPVHTRTYRFEKSPIPYMTKLLNDL